MQIRQLYLQTLEYLSMLTGISPEYLFHILVTILGISVVLIFRKLFVKIINSNTQDEKKRFHWRKIINYFTILIIILLIVRIWIGGISTILTILGLIAAALTITLKEAILNLSGWVYIFWRKPFVIGDRVEICGQSGDIIDVGFFRFIMLEIGQWVDDHQSTGRITQIPNGLLLTNPLSNATQAFNFIWNEIPITLSFTSNWSKAKYLLEMIAKDLCPDYRSKIKSDLNKVKEQYIIEYDNFKPKVYTKITDEGIKLSLRYLCPARMKRETAHQLTESILNKLQEQEEIEIVGADSKKGH